MRKWIRYYLDGSMRGIKHKEIDDNFIDHSRHMGSYGPDESYESRETFFRKYFFGYHFRRLEYYDDFLRKHLPKGNDVLSVASGRSANELFLIKDGWRITCSDLDVISAYKDTKKLFPEFEFMKLNILTGPAPKAYDAMVVLSLIYLFDDEKLRTFFENVSKTLKPGGHLMLDSAGSSDNLLTFFLHDIYLRFETVFMRIVKSFSGEKMPALIIKHHGWRRTDWDIAGIAKDCDLEVVARENYAFLTEFRRSVVFNKIVRDGSWAERVFGIIGKKMPYVRMFKFRKNLSADGA